VDTRSAQLVSYLQSLPGFEIVTPPEESYNHMGATLTDAVLQAGVNYKHVVQPRVERIRLNYPEATTANAFLVLLEQESTQRILNWKGQRKPDTLLTLTKFLVVQQVETESDLRSWLLSAENREALLTIKGIGAKTIDYLGLLVGEQTVAIDTHIFKLLRAANLPTQDYNKAHRLVSGAADQMGVPRASLDFSIWRYMSAVAK